MFMRESGLMFRTLAQFLFKITFSRGDGSVQNAFGNSREVVVVVGVWIFSGSTHSILLLVINVKYM